MLPLMIPVLLVLKISSVLCDGSELVPDCSKACNETEEFPKPACGTDGNVYSSQCSMQKVACQQRKEIAAQDWDKCIDKQSLCPDKCLDLYDPVCGQDNIIYINYCVMQRKNCGKRIKTQDLVSCMTRERQARKIECPEECAPIYEPVCDSLGDVHYNECFFRKAACGQEDEIKMLPLKACVNFKDRCPTKCLNINDPVCGSDGRRYQNHCKFAEENCKKNTKKMPWVYCLGEIDTIPQ